MPVTHFRVRWPDQSEEACYSPSSVVLDYFVAGKEYEINEFLERAREALGKASDRVRAKYGYACSSAMDQLELIEAAAAKFAGLREARVVFIGFGG